MRILAFITLALFLTQSARSQERSVYPSMSGEINFSGARVVTESGDEGGANLRFAPWFNLQIYANSDRKYHGYFLGFTVRNIGLIYQKDNERWIARTYNLGIPIGVKLGDMKGMFVYAGYEFEVPINYRERYYRNDSRERRFNVWFSDRVNPYTHSGFVGLNFPHGFNVKFKYYFTEFFNRSFNNSTVDDPRDLRYAGNPNDVNDPPRDFLKANIFYVGITWNMFRKPHHYYRYKYEIYDSSEDSAN